MVPVWQALQGTPALYGIWLLGLAPRAPAQVIVDVWHVLQSGVVLISVWPAGIPAAITPSWQPIHTPDGEGAVCLYIAGSHEAVLWQSSHAYVLMPTRVWLAGL